MSNFENYILDVVMIIIYMTVLYNIGIISKSAIHLVLGIL